MKDKDRFYLFGIGLVIGCVLVTLMVMRRDAMREESSGTWMGVTAESPDLAPLPEGVAEVMREGTVLFHREGESESVWVVGFTMRYPFVRMILDHASGEISYMAADQVVIQLGEQHEMMALVPHLDSLGIKVRTFNRRNRIVVVSTIVAGVDGVLATLEALAPFAGQFDSVAPDWILFRDSDRRGRFF